MLAVLAGVFGLRFLMMRSIFFAMNHPGAYRFFLQDMPLWLQGGTGLLLLASMTIMSLHLLSRAIPLKWVWLVFGLGCVWMVVFAYIPLHLSGSDFDEMFIIDKMIGAIDPGMGSRVPYFSYFDWFYRIADLLPFSFFLTGRFAVNGWFYFLYQINMIAMLIQFLAKPAAACLGEVRAAVLAAVAAANIGLVILCHTVRPELAAATMLMLLFGVLENIRRGQRGRLTTLGLVICAGGAFMLQVFSSNQFDMLAFPVISHAILISYRHRCGVLSRSFLSGLLASSAFLFFARERSLIASRLADPSQEVWATAGIVVLGAAYIVVRAVRSGTLRRWFLSLDNDPWSPAVIGLYLLPVCLIFSTTYLARVVHTVDSARYSSLFYPFLVIALGYTVLRLRWLRLWKSALLAVLAIYWNVPYLTKFYLSNSSEREYNHNGRQRQAVEIFLSSEPEKTFLYLPIPRDHNDSYLVKSVRPAAKIRSICSRPPATPGEMLLFSRHTLDVVLDEEKLNIPLDISFRPAHDSKWEVQFVDARHLDSSKFGPWCARMPHPSNPP